MPSSLLAGEDDADMDFDLLFDEDTGRGEGDQSWHDDTCMHMNLRVMRRLLATNTDAFDRKVRVGWRQHMRTIAWRRCDRASGERLGLTAMWMVAGGGPGSRHRRRMFEFISRRRDGRAVSCAHRRRPQGDRVPCSGQRSTRPPVLHTHVHGATEGCVPTHLSTPNAFSVNTLDAAADVDGDTPFAQRTLTAHPPCCSSSPRCATSSKYASPSSKTRYDSDFSDMDLRRYG